MRREVFHHLLQDILGSGNVYYQPPAELKMKYPCIRYEESNMSRAPADNHGYRVTQGYTMTYISKKPNPHITDQLARLPMCRPDRQYKSSGLYHSVYTIYV